MDSQRGSKVTYLKRNFASYKKYQKKTRISSCDTKRGTKPYQKSSSTKNPKFNPSSPATETKKTKSLKKKTKIT